MGQALIEDAASPALRGDQIFLSDPAIAAEPERLLRYQALLTDDERARQSRLVFARDRQAFAVTRALVRATLSRYAPVAPRDWRFTAGEHGRPRVCGPVGIDAPHFSVSHCAGLIACLVSRQVQAAIDVEAIRSVEDDVAIARRHFAPDEAAAVRGADREQRRELFLALWTLKESYLKALGRGLSLPLDAAAFTVAGATIAARLDPLGATDPGHRWRFQLWRPSPGHLLALARATTTGQVATAPRFFWTVPLETATPATVALVASGETAAT